MNLYKLLLVVGSLSLMSSCSQDGDEIYLEKTNKISFPTVIVEYAEIETEIFYLVNTYRQQIGIPKLKTLNIISKVADSHTDYMIEMGKVSHDNFPKRYQELMKLANAKLVGENIAYGYSSANSVVNGWIKSYEHREIIENPNYTHFGISTQSNKEGRNYFTHIFIEM